MPLPAALPLALGAPVVAVRVADVDGDGVQELVAQVDQEGAARLEVWALREGAPRRRARHALPDRPGWWDAGHGLWWADADGVVELQSGERRAAVDTGLPAQGGGPAQATMVVDLDGDGAIELLVPTPDGAVALASDGARLADLRGAAEVALVVTTARGGQVRTATVQPPAVAQADWDGDGIDDVLLVGPRTVTVHPWRAGGGAGPAREVDLPRALHPPGLGPDADPSLVTATHWVDLTGDGRADLLVHRLRSDGRLAGTEAELRLHANQGDRLGAPVVQGTGAGGHDAYPVDLDLDGYLDVLLPQLSLDAGNLAQAVLRRTVDVQVTRVPGTASGLGAPEQMGTLPMPVEDATTAWTFFDDLDGDGLPDLAVAVDGALRVLPGRGDRLAGRPSVELDLGLPATHLWAADLTGDGAPELVAWAPGLDRLVFVRLR